jgi:hypothetical protein
MPGSSTAALRGSGVAHIAAVTAVRRASSGSKPAASLRENLPPVPEPLAGLKPTIHLAVILPEFAQIPPSNGNNVDSKKNE